MNHNEMKKHTYTFTQEGTQRFDSVSRGLTRHYSWDPTSKHSRTVANSPIWGDDRTPGLSKKWQQQARQGLIMRIITRWPSTTAWLAISTFIIIISELI